MLLLVLVMVLALVLVLVMVLRGWQKTGDMADAFGDSLPKEQFSAQTQILRVFDEVETNDGPLTCTQHILQQHRDNVKRCGYTLCDVLCNFSPFHEGTPRWLFA